MAREAAPLQAIAGFVQDEEGHWVALLACGHRQHMRHVPPFIERPWVATEQGRVAKFGTAIPCSLCLDDFSSVYARSSLDASRTMDEARVMTNRLPLDGIRVLDVSSFIAAPAAAVVLGDYGADVIKVEAPGEGDPHRTNIQLASFPKAEVNYPWHLDARNKRSVALDLKSKDGRAALDRLIESADVMITNFPFPVRDRLTLGYEAVAKVNPKLIYASFSGYGEEGDEKDQLGFDANAFFGRAGILDQARYEGQPPAFALPAQGDRCSAMSLVTAIMIALFDRARTGKGTWVASSLYANGLWSNGVHAQAALLGSYLPPRPPRDRPRSAVANIFVTKDDRWMQVSVVREDKMWSTFLTAIERPDLASDPRFAETAIRRKNAALLTTILDPIFKGRTWAEWHAILLRHNLPHSPIARAEDISVDPQAVAAKAIVPTAIAEMPRTIAAPFQVGGHEPRKAGPGPGLGAHTDEILRAAGYSVADIAAMRKSGAVG
ncbi:MAG TPA: DUF3565 domain-containing protein [Hyphomicrobiaceae bacterium]|nr:DUF3565 domain-containing protein [Hyphomicrobiaceae bacterium]